MEELWLWVIFTCTCWALPPQPVITLHPGTVGLYDRLLETDFDGSLEVGHDYTLEIFMGNTDEYDYVIEGCQANGQSFMDAHGCLRTDNAFKELYETDQYTHSGALKRTLVHFVAFEVDFQFECTVKVIRCVGCAERSCNRRPDIQYYPSFSMPISCHYPMQAPYVMPPSPGYPLAPPAPAAPPPPASYPVSGGVILQDDEWRWLGVPWWLWLLFLILLLILLCLLIFGFLCCLIRRRRKPQTTVYTDNNNPLPPPIFKVHNSAQTNNEFNAFASQTSNQLGIRKQLDRHGSVRLRNEHPDVVSSRQKRRFDAERRHMEEQLGAYNNSEFVGDVYEEDGIEKVVTESRIVYATEISSDRHGDYSTNYRSRPTVQQRLQRELEEHYRQQQRQLTSDDFVEDQVGASHAEHYNKSRNLHHPNEAFREETVRSMRQSSVI